MSSSLTPLGPGGRPMARWRPLVALLAVAALVGAGLLLLSDRAPDVVDEVADEVRRRAPSDTRRSVRDAVDRTGVEESDTFAHIGIWAAATVLVGLAMWSWRSLVAAVVVLVGGSTGLELVQEELAPTRISETSDLLANAVGIGLGLAVVVLVSTVSGVPARLRRRSRAGPAER